MLPPRRQDIDAVFLDAGNTLVTLDHALVCEVLAAEGVRVEPAALARAEAAARPAVSRMLGGGVSSEQPDTFTFYVQRILERLAGAPGNGDPAALATRVVRALRGGVATQRLWSHVLPGVPEALQTLRDAGLSLVVVSNSDGTVEDGLGAVGLRSLLHGVVDSAVVGAEKPDPAIFRHALDLAGTRPDRTLHVGDLYSVDVLGARAAGLHAVLLDPYGDWDDVDCPLATDLHALARALLDGGDRT
jgi:putative hydrolase of the HAD superfamily